MFSWHIWTACFFSGQKRCGRRFIMERRKGHTCSLWHSKLERHTEKISSLPVRVQGAFSIIWNKKRRKENREVKGHHCQKGSRKARRLIFTNVCYMQCARNYLTWRVGETCFRLNENTVIFKYKLLLPFFSFLTFYKTKPNHSLPWLCVSEVSSLGPWELSIADLGF